MVDYEASEALVPGAETALQNRGVGSLPDILAAHFRNGLGRFSLSEAILKKQEDDLLKLKIRDNSTYQQKLAAEKASFQKEHGLLARIFGAQQYVPPPEESALDTQVYQSTVEVGKTLLNYIRGLEQFAAQFQNVGKSYQELIGREATLRQESDQAAERLADYPREAEALTGIRERLERYATLSREEQAALQAESQERYHGIPLEDAAVRPALCRMIHETIFALGQSQVNDTADVQVLQIQLDSVQRQKVQLQTDAQRLWELYTPARIEAARLKAAYDELSSAAERGTLILNISTVLQTAQEICERARESQLRLEAAIEGNMDVWRSHQQLVDGADSPEERALTASIAAAAQITSEK